MNTDQLAADFEQWIIKTFGVTWERSGIMHQFKSAIEKATDEYSAAAEQAIDILVMQDNAGKGRSQAELSRRIEQAISMLRQSRAAHASEPWTPDKVLEILDEAEEKDIVWNIAIADARNATTVIAPTKEFMECQSPQSDDTKRLDWVMRNGGWYDWDKELTREFIDKAIDAAMSQTKEKE